MTKQEREEKARARAEALSAPEREMRASGIRCIAGIDEVGRGPLAGPVYAACVVLPAEFDGIWIDDSKKLSEKKRRELDLRIRAEALAVGIGTADPGEIDDHNILNATKLAMVRAVRLAEASLPQGIELLLIDAVSLPELNIPQRAIVKGDATCLSIAAASIVAKVARDAYMIQMEERYPGYGFASNKGYGTAAHYAGLRAQGLTPIHRRSFLKNFGVGQEERKTMAKKFYAVRKGVVPGLYTTWAECKAQVDGFRGAEYKGFGSKEEALSYLDGGAPKTAEDGMIAYVDGSYDVVSGHYSCGAVILENGIEIERKACYTDEAGSALRNVAGEIMGARLAIAYALEQGAESLAIYHDYAGIGKWGDDEWKANLPMTQDYKAFVREARKRLRIRFVKVKGHSGNAYNDRADALAKAALGK